MPTELEFLKILDEDIQQLRSYTNKSRYEHGGWAVSADNLATGLKVKVSDRIVELEKETECQVTTT